MTLNWSSLQASAIRLLPGTDLKSELFKLAIEQPLHAAAVMAAVGSLSTVALRFANRPETTMLQGKYEIISLSGTFSKAAIHLHLSVANSEGQMFGGHLMEGSVIYTTAEIVIAEMNELIFSREHCQLSGFKELLVTSRDDLEKEARSVREIH